MHQFARSTCQRHINCHLKSLLCQQGSTSSAVHFQAAEPPRQFSTSRSRREQAGSGADDLQESQQDVSDKDGSIRPIHLQSIHRPYHTRPNSSRRIKYPRAPPSDGTQKDPLRAIERLATIKTPAGNIESLLREATDSIPILKAGSEGRALAAMHSHHRDRHNSAVGKTIAGVARKNWNTAFKQGWSVLYHQDGSHAKLNMQTTENMVQLWSVQTEKTITADWQEVLHTLLIPATLREIELQYEHNSVVSTWMYSELRKATPEAQRRVIEYWTTLVEYAREHKLAEKRGDPYFLLQLPSNLFSVALLAYLQSSHSLKAFIGSFYQVIAVPMGYAPRMAGNRIREEMRKLSGSHSSSHRNMTDEDSTELDFWLRQMPLLRIWARHGPRSFHMACSTWRERTFQSAAVTTWDALQEGLVRATRQPEDSWIAIDWSPIEERRDRRLNDDTQQSSASHDQQTLWRDRPKLPLRFTPDIAADFLRTFLHIDLPDRAESAWLFMESHNMTPSLVMWNALLTGHLHRKDLEAAEAVYQEMEKTKDAKPDMVARSVLITAYFHAGRIEAGVNAVNELMASRGKPGSAGGDAILTTRVYNNIINALLWDNNSPDYAWEIFQQMQDEGSRPDIYTVNILLRHYSRRSTFDLEGVTRILEVISEYGLEPDSYTLSMLLDALILAGRADAVNKVQEIMKALGVEPNTATYGAMINHLVKGAIKSGDIASLNTALDIMRKMQASGDARARPTEITYSNLIQGFSRFAVVWQSPDHLSIAETLHEEMLELGIPPNRITYNSLMAAHLAQEDIPKALYYFSKYRQLKGRRFTSDREASEAGTSAMDSTFHQNVPIRSWQTLVTGLVEKKHYADARAVLEEMRDLGLAIHSPAFQKVAAIAMSGGKSHGSGRQAADDY